MVRDGNSASIGYSDEIEFSTFAYKRDNHFQERMNATLAKQNSNVPQDVLDQIMETLFTHRIRAHDVTAKKVRDTFKTLKLRKYYDCSMQIACVLSGKSPPRMTPEVEQRLRDHFRIIQPPFEILPDRKVRFCIPRFIDYSLPFVSPCLLFRSNAAEFFYRTLRVGSDGCHGPKKQIFRSSTYPHFSAFSGFRFLLGFFFRVHLISPQFLSTYSYSSYP